MLNAGYKNVLCSNKSKDIGQICYSTEVNQFLNWLTETVHRTVSFRHSNPAFPFPKQKGHPKGCPFCFGGTGQI